MFEESGEKVSCVRLNCYFLGVLISNIVVPCFALELVKCAHLSNQICLEENRGRKSATNG